jgi:hypothetical protein
VKDEGGRMKGEGDGIGEAGGGVGEGAAVGVAGKVEAGVSAEGAVVVVASTGAAKGVAAVVGSMTGVVGVGVAADWQPRRRTAESRRVNNRLRLRITRVNVRFCPILSDYKKYPVNFVIMSTI